MRYTGTDEQQKKDLVERAKKLGFEWRYNTDNTARWITLFKSDAPPRMRYQFEDSPEGLSELNQFLNSQLQPLRGAVHERSDSKSGHTVWLDLDTNDEVSIGPFAGCDAVTFYLGTPQEARALYQAMLSVVEIEAD